MSTVCVTRAPEVTVTGGHEEDIQRAGVTVEQRLASSPFAQAMYQVVLSCWTGFLKMLSAQRPNKKYLRVCENVSLGDKRFIAVIQVGQERFLVGGAANSIAMLTKLEASPTFSAAMKDCSEAGPELQ